MPVAVPQALLVSAIVAVGAAVQGSLGFGAALLAAPLLALIDPVFAPGPMLLAGLVLTTLVALRDRASVDLRGVGWAVAGRVPGTAIGAAALALLPERELAVLFAVLVLVAVALTASGLRVRPTSGNLIAAGVASGVMGTMTSIGGPPIALVYQNAEGPTLRGTMGAYFIVSGVLSLIGLAVVGRLGDRELHASLVLLPGVLVGFFASRWSRTLLDRGLTRPAVLALSAVAAASVLAKQW